MVKEWHKMLNRRFERHLKVICSFRHGILQDILFNWMIFQYILDRFNGCKNDKRYCSQALRVPSLMEAHKQIPATENYFRETLQ